MSREVLLIGGSRDGQRVTLEHGREIIFAKALTFSRWLSGKDEDERYEIHSLRAGEEALFFGTPDGCPPEEAVRLLWKHYAPPARGPATD